MGVKRILKNKVEDITGWHIFRDPPFGVSITDDIAHRFPEYRFKVIFDVGANVGQSAIKYVKSYPSSSIYASNPLQLLTNNLRERLKVKEKRGV